MKIYLVRHGEATPQPDDSLSPLSEKGRYDVGRLGRFLSHAAIRVETIFYSKKLRAQQTAEILAKEIKFRGKIEMHPGLAPMDSVVPVASELAQATDDIMLVGHMPFMGKLVAKLVNGNECDDVVAFQTATLVCLERIENSKWIITAVITPNLY
jgi:phosphohistidine phosphatase